MVEIELLNYIRMDGDRWKSLYPRYARDIDRFWDLVEETEFEAGYVLQNHRDSVANADNPDTAIAQIRAALDQKELPDAFIDSYIEALGEEDTGRAESAYSDALSIYVNTFTYEGREIREEDLTRRLDRERFDIVDEDNRQASINVIQAVLEQGTFPDLTPGLESIIEYGSRQALEPVTESPFEMDEVIGRSDWRIRNRRQSAYDYWEEVDDRFDKLREAVGNFVKTIKEYEGDADHEELNKELAQNFKEIKAFQEKIDSGNLYNYVKRYYKVTTEVESNDIRDVETNALNLIQRWFADLFETDRKFTAESQQRDEDEIQEEQYTYETAGQHYDVEGGRTVDITPQPSMELESYRVDDEMAQVLEEIEETKVRVKSLDEVDPLFSWVVNEGGFPEGAYNKEAAQAMTVQIKNAIQGWEADEDAKKQFKNLLEKVDKFIEYAADAEGPFYLPMNLRAISVIGTGEEVWSDSYHLIEDAHYDFLETVGELMENPHDRTRTNKLMNEDDWRFGVKPKGGYQKKTEDEKQHRITIRQFTPSKVGGKRDIKEYANAFTLLLEAIDSYYVKPSTSKWYPWSEIPEFLQTEFLTALRLKGKGIESTSEDIWNTYFLSMLTKTEMQTLIDFLTIISNPITDITSVSASMNRMLKILNSSTMYGDYKKDSENFFAYHLRKIVEKNDGLELSEQTELNGTPVLTILQRDINMNKQYPIEELINTIWYFRKDLENKNQYIGAQITELINLIDSWEHFTKSELEVNIMFAHDEIRKMAGKPIYYSLGVPDNFDNVNATIDLMKSKYGIELTANDVIGIVDEFDSMSSIGKKYGTKEEVVYHVKALYR